MKAGRGENGYSATLDILPADPTDAIPTGPVMREASPSASAAAFIDGIATTTARRAAVAEIPPEPETVTEEKPAPKPVSTRKPFAGLGSVKTTTAAPEPIANKWPDHSGEGVTTVSEDGEIIEPEQADETQAGISSGEDRGEAELPAETGELPEENPAPKPAVKSIFSKAG